MRPVNEITDDCLSKMDAHELMDWDNWWSTVVRNGKVPTRKTWAYSVYIDVRNKIKMEINIELERRQRPERLMCPGSGKGIYLVNEDDVAEIVADSRIRKIVNCFHRGHQQMLLLSECKKISMEDKKMLERLSSLVELQQNTMIGTMAKMRSLPPATKERLLKKLGYDK